MSGNVKGRLVRDGLLIYIDPANPQSFVSGSTISYDLSKNGNNCTLLNGASYSSLGYGSFTFDGTNDLISIPSIGTLNDFTISSWFQITGAGNTGQTIYSTLVGLGSDNRILVATGANKRVLVQMGGTDYFSTTTCPFNTWNNVTYTYNSTTNTAQLYVNNIKQTPQSNSSVSYINGIHWIGSANNVVFDYVLEGYSSSFFIYNRTLSDDEVTNNYNTLRGRFGR
jgi:Fe-S cluster assembly iron-binding protein IscA